MKNELRKNMQREKAVLEPALHSKLLALDGTRSAIAVLLKAQQWIIVLCLIQRAIFKID